MNVDRVVQALSGTLFAISGIALLLGVKAPLALDPKIILGTSLILIGISVVLGASLASSILLALSVVTLIVVTSSSPGLANLELSIRGSSARGNLSSCESLYLKNVMSSLVLENGFNVDLVSYEGKAPKGGIAARACEMNSCCSQLTVKLPPLKELELTNLLSSAKGSLHGCIRELKVDNVMSDSKLRLELTPDCSAIIELKSVFGSINLELKVPKGTKVSYDLKASFGSATVETPEGEFSRGTYGKGGSEVVIRGNAVFGEIRVKLTDWEGR